MKIVVTGCAGFIGSHLCEALCEEGHEVFGIDNLNHYYDPSQKRDNLCILKRYPKFFFRKDDLCDTTVIRDFEPSVIIHLGAMAGVRYSLEHPELYMKVNVEGQAHLLKEAVEMKVKLFIYASSSSVYGLNTKIPFSETDPLEKMNCPYAVSKRTTELLAKLYSDLYQLPTLGLRFFTVYGPRGRPDMAPYLFLKAIKDGTTFKKYGTGETYRDYTYIDDIVAGILGALRNKKKCKCEVYNLGNSSPVSLNTFIATCEKVTGKEASYVEIEPQKGDVPRTFADITKAKEDLDYCPVTTLEGGLKQTYEWMEEYFKK